MFDYDVYTRHLSGNKAVTSILSVGWLIQYSKSKYLQSFSLLMSFYMSTVV